MFDPAEHVTGITSMVPGAIGLAVTLAVVGISVGIIWYLITTMRNK